MAEMDTKKARQKRRKRARRAMGLHRPSHEHHETPRNQQLGYQDIFQFTEFDALRALQDGLPQESLALPNLDSWGWPFFLMLISTFFTGTYARMLEKPYRLPKAPLGQPYGTGTQNPGDSPAYSTDDLYYRFATATRDEDSPFTRSGATQSESGLAPSRERVKRSSGLDRYRHSSDHAPDRLHGHGYHHHHHHHRHHRRRHQRRHVEAPTDPLQNAIVYPEEKLSPWMKNLINSVGSVISLFGPALRAIGFEPDEMMDVQKKISGTQHLPIAPIKITAADFAMYLTAKGNEGFTYEPLTDRGRELERIITEKGRYGEQNFFAKEVLDPLKDKFRSQGLRAIGDKFDCEHGLFLEHRATLYHVTGKRPFRLNPNFARAEGHPIKGELGTIVEIPGEPERYFAIVPHHPDMVIPIPDPNSDEGRWWLRSKGKHLFFSDPSTFPNGSTFSAAAEDSTNIAPPSHTLRGVLLHTIKPIITGTTRHMTELVTNETPAEKMINRLFGFIPFYDTAKSLVNAEYQKAIVFLSFDLVPYVGRGAKVLFKTTFRGFAARAAADKVARLASKVDKTKIKEAFGGDFANAIVEKPKRND